MANRPLLRALATILVCLGMATMSSAKDQGSVAVASILLNTAAMPDFSGVIARFEKRAGKAAITGPAEISNDIVLLPITDGQFMVALMPTPVPKDELAETCQTALYYWPEACEVAQSHTAHLLVTVMHNRADRLDAALMHTNLVAAVAEESSAAAVYWGTSLQSGIAFVEGSQNASRESPPVNLWVALRFSREASGRPSMSTSGMDYFDLMEIEAKDSRIEFEALYNLTFGLAQYLITSGPVIKDKDTFGHTQEQRIRIRHANSFWNRGQKVYRIEK